MAEGLGEGLIRSTDGNCALSFPGGNKKQEGIGENKNE